MAVTVISRPLGHKLIPTPIYARAGVNVGDVLINKDGHGLTTGNYVYVESELDSYNGFLYVNVFDANNFKLQYSSTEFVPFIKEVYLYYYVSELDHGWQCVHLPIVYELESDLYQVNSVDTIFAPLFPYTSNPYVNFQLTVGHGLVVLDYVLFKEYPDSEGEVVQVLSVTNLGATDLIIINLPSAGTDLYSAQKVRNNYHIDVRVYAGLPSGHTWESEKPYELASTLKFIPDSNNQIKFSISEILKGYITTRNNLTLDTLPNNIDFFTEFYIEYAEGYDVSDGTEVTAFLDEFTDDSGEFEGQAVNAMLPFKNIYSGFMSEYLLYADSGARFLTTFDVPILFENYYFDISILVKEGLPPLLLKKVWYFTDGTISHTETTAMSDFDEGVYRLQLEAQCSRTYEVVTTAIDSEWGSNTDGWYYLTPDPYDWGWGNSPDYFGDGSGYIVKTAFAPVPFYHNITLTGGETINFKTQFGGLDDNVLYNLQVYVVEAVTGLIHQIANYDFYKDVLSGDNFRTIDLDIVLPAGTTFNQIYIHSYVPGADPDNVVYVNYFRITSTEEVTKNINSVVVSVVDSDGNPYTEEKTIRVVCECGDTLLADDVRLIESGGLRELE